MDRITKRNIPDRPLALYQLSQFQLVIAAAAAPSSATPISVAVVRMAMSEFFLCRRSLRNELYRKE